MANTATTKTATKSQLPLYKRIHDAVDRIGTSNGTKVPTPVLPADIETTNNELVNEFFEKHELVADYYVLDTLRKHIDGQFEAQKKKVLARFNIRADALTAGDSKTYVLDNMSLTYKTSNARALLNREALQVVLMTKLSALGLNNLTLEQTQSIIEMATMKGKPPLSLIAATTAE